MKVNSDKGYWILPGADEQLRHEVMRCKIFAEGRVFLFISQDQLAKTFFLSVTLWNEDVQSFIIFFYCEENLRAKLRKSQRKTAR
jgi:hypothetical protein